LSFGKAVNLAFMIGSYMYCRKMRAGTLND
jgi:hypothetical protein